MNKRIINALSTGYGLMIVLSILGMSFPQQSWSNNLTLSNISVDQSAQTVTFTIEWENSWRITTNDAPHNWDAAWVFVKFKDCSALPSVQFTQGLVSTNLGDHSFGSLQAVQSAGLTTTPSGGYVPPSAIDAAPNNTGVMLIRSTDGLGSNSTTVTLKITNMPLTGTLDTRVFGIEMVFIKDGPFAMGDGNGASTSSAWGSVTTVSPSSYVAYTVNSEAAIPNYYEKDNLLMLTMISYSNYCNGIINGTMSITADYPKGYNAFYIMKYEITQGQYADFLNTIPFGHYPGQYGVNRHAINNAGTSPNVYNCIVSNVDKGDRACNWLSWNDVSAYLDWACLRPLTEFEYEKACRGIVTITGLDYAWGNSAPIAPGTTSIGPENGTEASSTAGANCNYNNVTFAAPADPGQGPVRAGIFAKPTTTTRAASGGSYFGVMELSGNVSEYYVSVYAGSAAAATSTQPSLCNPAAFPIGVARLGLPLGDGTLDPALHSHNVTGWPNGLSPEASSVIRRGGGWSSGVSSTNVQASNLQVSNRGGGLNAVSPVKDSGGRGGRN